MNEERLILIEKLYEKLENDRNLEQYLLKYIEDARDEEHKIQKIVECAQLAGVFVTPEEIRGYAKAGIEKITQRG